MRALAVAALLLPLGCATSRPADAVADRFQHRVAFERGAFESNGIDSLEILEVWGTRPEFEIGGEYVFVGRYVLASEDGAIVTCSLTAHNWDNSGPWMDLQRQSVGRGRGTFVLHNRLAGPGQLHVFLEGANGDLADQYVCGGVCRPHGAVESAAAGPR